MTVEHFVSPALTAAQKKLRSKGICSSDIAAIAGLSPWRSALDVYMEKTGKADGDRSDNRHTRRGHWMETYLAEEYRIETGSNLLPGGTVVHPEFLVCIATPDRFIDGEGILECKAPTFRMSRDWGEAGTDQVPRYYIPQVMWQLGACGQPWADVIATVYDDIRIYRIEYHQRLFDVLLEKALRFWHNHIEKDKAPEPTHRESDSSWLRELYPFSDDTWIESSDSTDALVKGYAEARELREKHEKKELELKARLQSAIGGHAGIRGSWGFISWRNSKPVKKTDYKAILHELQVDQKIIDKFTKEEAPRRVFLPRIKGDET